MKNKKPTNLKSYSFIVLFLFVVCLPFFTEIMASIKTSSSIDKPFRLIPGKFISTSYSNIFDNTSSNSSFSKFLVNSFAISSITTIVSIAIAFYAAYALARIDFKGKKIVMGFFIAMLIVPPISIISPLYTLVKDMGIKNTDLALIIPYFSFTLPLAVLNLTLLFKRIPCDLEEAAIVDGASTNQAVMKIFLPLATPAILITSIMVFVVSWGEYLFAMTINNKDISRTATTALSSQTGYGEIAAAATVIIIPIILLVLIFQKRIFYETIEDSKTNRPL